MNLTKQDYINAVKALKDNEIIVISEKGTDKPKYKYTREYSGRLSSIGPDTIYMGLKPAIALYESKPKDAGLIKVRVCKAILDLLPNGKNYNLLYEYVSDTVANPLEQTQYNIDKAILALKLTIRLFIKEN